MLKSWNWLNERVAHIFTRPIKAQQRAKAKQSWITFVSQNCSNFTHKCLNCYLNYTYLISCSLELSCCCIFISVFTSCLLMVWSCLTTCPIWLWSVVTNVYSVFTCTVNSPTLEWRLLWKEHEKRIWFPVIVRI